jgi:cytochrome c biogenesis protein CcmG/thiol:disulfide interchange protein DsbE
MDENGVTSLAASARRLPTWVVALAFLFLIAFLALIGWSMRRSQAGPIIIGQHVPPFTLTTFDGQTIGSVDFSNKVVVINFWASWCKPCEQEASELEQAWRYYQTGGDVIFIGVDYVDTELEALEYLKQFEVTYPNGPDLRTVISQMFRTTGVPETYILDRQGKLAYVKKGPFLSIDEITTVIDGLR